MRVDLLGAAAAVPPGSEVQERLELLEMLLFLGHHDDIPSCARLALQWLGEHAGVEQAFCAVIDPESEALEGLAGYQCPVGAVERFSLSLEETRHPLIRSVDAPSPVLFSGEAGPSLTARPHPQTPIGSSPFFSIPLRSAGAEGQIAVGLLLVKARGPEVSATVTWAAEVLGKKLEQLRARGVVAEGERRFRRERTLLHSIINAVSDPILLTDTDGRLLLANAPAEALFSTGENISDGRRRAIELNNMFFSAALSRTALDDPGSSRRELLLVNPDDGSDLLFELLSTIVDDPREGSGVVSVLRNISDLRRASLEIEANYTKMRLAEADTRAERDRLNLIIDSVADPILVTDPEGSISLMNAPAEKLFTVEPGSEDVARRLVRANDAHFSSFISALLVSGSEQRRIGEVSLVDMQGQPLPVEAIAGKVLSDLGELTAVVTVLHDRREAIEKARLYERLKAASDELEAKVLAATSELADQNERLRRQALELEQASALKSQFLANMSHEFRTPLNAVLGYTAMLLEGVSGELNPSQKRQLQRVDSNSRHLLGIINEILDITRIEAGRMPLQVTKFSIAELIKEVISELEPLIERKPVRVIADVDPLPPIISDRQKVKQILLNLLNNAIKFTNAGSAIFHVQRSGPRLVIRLTDTGIGIPEAELDRIFEDFKQLDQTTTRGYGGTGLGLSICRRLALMLDGTIAVESTVGRGSTFTLCIPRRLKQR